MDLAANATQAPSAFWNLIKKYWLFAIVAIAALFVVAMAKKDSIIAAFTSKDSVAAGDKLPGFLRKWLGLATVLALGAGTLLYSGDALAAICCSAPDSLATAAQGPSSGFLSFLAEQWHTVLAALGGGGSLMLGMTQFGAPDVLDCEETHGGKSLAVGALSVTTAQSMFIKSATHATTKNGAPLVATDLTVEVACNITQELTGTATLDDQDFARLVSYIEIQSPYMGNLTDQKSCTGPVLDLVTRFLGDAFEKSGDAPVISIAVPTGAASSTAITKYFTRPFALRFLEKPLTTAPWLGLLHNTNISIGLAPDTCLAGLSTGAAVDTRVIRASVSYLPVPDWYYPMVAYDRVDSPASGSNGLTFKNFGGPGPECTQKIDFVHTIGHLSSLKGLGGNLTFDSLTQLLAPRFGLDAVTNISHLIKARLRAQYIGHIGGVDYNDSGNYVQGTANAAGMALDQLLFFFLVQPSLGMSVANMRRLMARDELPLQYETSSTRTGEDKFYIGAIREVTPAKVAEWRRLPSSGLPAAIGQIRNFRAGR